jgi:hypothetical protein
MAKINNNSSAYVRRSDLGPQSAEAPTKILPMSVERAEQFLSAPMDARFYVDLRSKIDSD